MQEANNKATRRLRAGGMERAFSEKSNGQDAIREEYARLAADYDLHWSFYIRETLQKTLKRLVLKPGCHLLDIGCGTGALFQMITEPTVHLLGLDMSVDMLQVARRKVRGRTQFIAGAAQVLPFASNKFDVVVSCNAFHYWREPALCLKEISRVLKPGGDIVITDWCDDYLTCRICDFFLRRFNLAHYRTYKSEQCKRLLENAGFQAVQVERYKINYLWGLMTATGKAHVETMAINGHQDRR